MKINIKNIVSEYPKIKQGSLPDALKQDEFDFVSENLDLYNDDTDIKKYIDTFVSKLNEVAGKVNENKKPVTKKKATSKKTNDLASKIAEINNKKTSAKKGSSKSNNNILVVKPAHGRGAKTKEETKKTKRSSSPKKKADNSKKVGSVDLQVTFIKSFVLMHGKEKTKKQVLNLYKRIEKAASELKIRKTSKFADEIIFVSNFLMELYNENEGKLDLLLDIEIPEKKYNELYEIAYSEKQRTSVALIKRYIGMIGLPFDEKAKKELLIYTKLL